MSQGSWPFPEFSIPSHPHADRPPVSPVLGIPPPAPSIDSEPQEIECEELSDLDVCIPEGDE